MPTAKQLSEIVATLAARFPDTFSVLQNARLPLKVGIHRDLAAVLGDSIDQKILAATLRYYTGNPGYLKAQKAGADRIGLDGHAAGVVSPEDAATAQQRLAAIAAKVKKPKPLRVEPRIESSRVEATPPKSKRLGLADLKAAALKRKAQMA
jgi:ProP effector